jgi:outer membrane lipopolysaccharide assembly protein LptE/RlpB
MQAQKRYYTRIFRSFMAGLLLLLLAACWPTSFSFRDGSVPEEWKRFMVETLESEAANAPISYAPELTEELKDAIQNRVGIKLVSSEKDDPQLIISGVVRNYDVAPVAVQGNDIAAKNRLTVSAFFEIFVLAPEEDVMQVRANRFVDFDANVDVGSVQAQLFEEINEQIIQDVLNKLLENW